MNWNSLQVRLQLWYGLVLLAVLFGLGLAAYQLEKSQTLRLADQKLRDRVKVLAKALNGPPPGAEPVRRGLPVQWFPPTADTFHLPARDHELFESDFYYRILGADGLELARSENFTGATNQIRLVNVTTPTGEMIMVGHPLAAEFAELHEYALKLAGIGGSILILGLAVGWLLVSCALRPIAEISLVAEKIAAGDLAQRISAAETQSELGRLATGLNSAFARLEAAFTLQKRFAADAAHELRTPISVHLAQTHAALAKPRSYEENLETIHACHRASQRMRHLIVSLLQLARLDAGQEPLRRQIFDLLPVVSEAVELLKPLSAERQLKITLDLKPAEIFGDASQLHQVVTNLVSNAIQYNRPGGTVVVSLSSSVGEAILQVCDTGIGLATTDLPHIFERFYRADKSRTSGNAGLGLAISKMLVDAHGGSMAVVSKENEGTIFTVRLPTMSSAGKP